jgi:hypothetical protein
MWRECERHPGYEVSSYGNVRNIQSGTIRYLEPHKGYLRFVREKNSKKFRDTVHRLVALAFIPNPDNHPQINHIDGDKQNNAVGNLEWCTPLQNVTHAIATGLQVRQKVRNYATQLHNPRTGQGLVLFGTQEIRAAGFDDTTVSNCIHRPGKYKSHRGLLVSKLQLIT